MRVPASETFRLRRNTSGFFAKRLIKNKMVRKRKKKMPNAGANSESSKKEKATNRWKRFRTKTRKCFGYKYFSYSRPGATNLVGGRDSEPLSRKGIRVQISVSQKLSG